MDRDCKCKQCGYEWVSRLDERPKSCPRCKRYDWDEIGLEKAIVTAEAKE